MITLRPYQTKAIEDLRAAMRKHHSVLLTAPTGAGKTALTVHMMATAASRGLSSMFLVHRQELLNQTSRALWRQKLEHGVIAPGKRDSKLPAKVASVATLVRRLDRYGCPDLIIIDEAHRAAAATYSKVLDAYPSARVVGLTATPQRTDGKGLDDIFDAIVYGPSVADLISMGFLCEYELYAPPTALDMSAVKTKAGDYDRHQAEEAVDKPTITGDAVKHYAKLPNQPRCVVFCVTVKHSRHVCEQYRAAGIAAEHVDGGTPDAERRAILERFAAGTTRVVCNVDLFIEGLDIPAVEVVQLLRPTKSVIIFLQSVGRGLRPAPGKNKLIIFDHVGNALQHGLPDDDREWSLQGRPKGKRKQSDEPDIKITQCQKCWAVFAPQPTCPQCGHPTGVEKRQIEVVDGELQKVDPDMIRRQQRKEQGSARGLRDLIELGIRRGMKSPSGWAVNVMAGRLRKKATAETYQQAKQIERELRG